MDETIEDTFSKKDNVCQICNEPIEINCNMWSNEINSITFSVGNKKLAKMHFECYVKGCVWAAKQAHEEEKSELYRKEFVTKHWSWDYDQSLNETQSSISEYVSIKEDLDCINRIKIKKMMRYK